MSAATLTPIASSTAAAAGAPLDPDRQAAVIRDFQRDGVAVVPGVLAAEAPRLRALVDALFADPVRAASHGAADGIVLSRAFELDRAFRDLLVAEPIISLVEGILGADCHMTSQNLLRTPPGRAIDGWHVDDNVYFPLPDEVPSHPASPPAVLLHAFVLLSDVPDDDHGPTQLVPGSHRSGRQPDPSLVFEGQGPRSILGRAGDLYVHHNQTWHRGAPNRSERTRYLIGTAYGRRWAAQRLWPFVDYRLPTHVTEGASERLLRVLGRHPSGAYG